MNLQEMKSTVMFQTNNDADDLGDFLPYVTNYLNEGYDRLVMAWAGEHVSEESQTYTPLKNDKASPELPEWTHGAIADWATWLVYRNVFNALLSHQEDALDTVYRYLILAFAEGRKVEHMLISPEVMRIMELGRSVSNEAHLFREIARFTVVQGRV